MSDEREPRMDLIRHLREQIAAGTYVTDGKLEIVCSQILAEIRDDKDPCRKVEGNPVEGL